MAADPRAWPDAGADRAQDLHPTARADPRREGGYGSGQREEAQGGEEKREREHGQEGSGEPGQHPDAGHGDDQTGVARREEGRYGMTTPLGGGRRLAVARLPRNR